MISWASIIFSFRTFAAAALALYLSFRLDLSRPTWAFITVYIVVAPLRGMSRSKGIYRMFGTLAGAVFSVIAVPNLVDDPVLLTLAIASWISTCLYLSILDGTPRAYAFMLAGFTAALISFPSVNTPQAIFDTALSRTEEIGLAVLCVELMGYLPFNIRAGDVLIARIHKCLIDARTWAVNLMTGSQDSIPATDRARLMIDAVALDALRVHARYDTLRFSDIEAWVVRLQRFIYDFFSDLITFETQIKALRADKAKPLSLLQPIIDAILAWIEADTVAMPEKLWKLLTEATHDPAMEPLIKCGIIDTISDLMLRRAECLALKEKITNGVKAEQGYVPVAYHVDRRQAAIYAFATGGMLIVMSAFWILTAWPDGGTAAMLATVICCFFASLEAPPRITFMFLIMSCIGSFIGWIYNFFVFPHIDGFVLLAYALGVSCIPIGILMANPARTALMIPVVIGINLASFQNRFDADITSFLNGFIAQTAGVLAAGAALSLVRVVSLRGATERLLTENGQALAALALAGHDDQSLVLDRMAHRAGMAFIRAPGLGEVRELVIRRMLSDLQAGRVILQIKAMLPKLSPALQDALRTILAKAANQFLARRGLKDPPPAVCDDLRNLNRVIDEGPHSYDILRLMGLMKTLSHGLGKEAA